MQHLLLVLLLATQASAQELNLFREEVGDSVFIFANNDHYCPMTLDLDLELDNMQSNKIIPDLIVIPSRAQHFLIASLAAINPYKSYQFSYESSNHYGNHTKSNADLNYVYWLPCQKTKSYTLHQGYNGEFSHQESFALDFAMPIGSEVTAAREGNVIDIVDHHSKQCSSKKCMKFNNLILIYHDDGTFAEYVHIKKNGALVKVGDRVKKGQTIAYSGNVGWSNGPHLHFAVFEQSMMQRKTVKTKFKIEDGSTSTYLNEKETYSRNY